MRCQTSLLLDSDILIFEISDAPEIYKHPNNLFFDFSYSGKYKNPKKFVILHAQISCLTQ